MHLALKNLVIVTAHAAGRKRLQARERANDRGGLQVVGMVLAHVNTNTLHSVTSKQGLDPRVRPQLRQQRIFDRPMNTIAVAQVNEPASNSDVPLRAPARRGGESRCVGDAPGCTRGPEVNIPEQSRRDPALKLAYDTPIVQVTLTASTNIHRRQASQTGTHHGRCEARGASEELDACLDPVLRGRVRV